MKNRKSYHQLVFLVTCDLFPICKGCSKTLPGQAKGRIVAGITDDITLAVY